MTSTLLFVLLFGGVFGLAVSKRQSPCLQRPKVAGLCRMYIPSFSYNPVTNKCEKFIYGGCGGNKNRFSSKGNCRRRCRRGQSPCLQRPKVAGLCRMYIPSFSYNPVTNNCEKFIYGGCGGNKNRFSSKKNCRRHCRRARCLLPKKRGPCKAYKTRYYYNDTTGRCEPFRYGGCRGNANNFVTKLKCRRVCIKRRG